MTTLDLPRVEKQSMLWQNVLPILRHAILSGRLTPGTRLVPEKLAQELGVSRGPVTEAIRRLQEEGLVSVAPNGRPYVRGLTQGYVQDLYAFRANLDILASKTALAYADPVDLSSLTTTLQRMATLQTTGDIKGLTDADVTFHEQLITLAQNTVVNRVWAGIADFSRSLLAVTDELKSTAPSVADIHAAIVAALAAGDLAAAEKAILTHYKLGEELLVASGLVQPG